MQHLIKCRSFGFTYVDIETEIMLLGRGRDEETIVAGAVGMHFVSKAHLFKSN